MRTATASAPGGKPEITYERIMSIVVLFLPLVATHTPYARTILASPAQFRWRYGGSVTCKHQSRKPSSHHSCHPSIACLLSCPLLGILSQRLKLAWVGFPAAAVMRCGETEEPNLMSFWLLTASPSTCSAQLQLVAKRCCARPSVTTSALTLMK